VRSWAAAIVIVFVPIAGSMHCAAAKGVARTVNDAARILCELVAAEQPQDELAGLSPGEWCAIKKNLDPFIEEALKAQKAGAHRAGLRRAGSADGGTD
jgi:hypothetical protein